MKGWRAILWVPLVAFAVIDVWSGPGGGGATGPAAVVVVRQADPAAPRCAPLRLDLPGGPMGGAPFVLAPGESCYASAAVRLVDAWRCSHGGDPATVSSPLHAALVARVERGTDWGLSGGFACATVDALVAAGTCPQAAVETVTGVRPRQQVLADLEACHRCMLGIDCPTAAGALRACRRARRHLVGEAGVPEEAAVEAALAAGDLSALARLSERHFCGAEARLRVTSHPRCETWTTQTGPEGSLARLDHLLEREPALPVGVTFCAGLYPWTESGGARWRRDAWGHLHPVAGDRCDAHAAVVVGRRLHGGVCQYLLLEAGPAFAGTDGRVWVDGDHLARQTLSLFHLQEAEPGPAPVR